MATLIRQIQPAWYQVQRMELPVPAHALRQALLALGVGLLVMADHRLPIERLRPAKAHRG